MSIHSDCGAEIRWPRKQDDLESFGPPLEYAGQGYIFDENGSTVQVSVYKNHICQASQMEVWLDNKARIAKLQKTSAARLPVTNEAYKLAREEAQTANRKRALTVACPTCQAAIGDMCTHVITSAVLRNPHTSRLTESMRRDKDIE
jgi:hypothetical protein